MEEIASRAGLSRATLYLHFSGKSHVYQVLLQKINAGFAERIESLVTAEHSAPRKLRLFTELTAQTYEDNPVLVAAVTGDKNFSIQKVSAPILSEQRTQILDCLQRILRQGIEESTIRNLDVEETAFLMYELGNRLIVGKLAGELEYPLGRILDVMDDLLANGIRQKTGGNHD